MLPTWVGLGSVPFVLPKCSHRRLGLVRFAKMLHAGERTAPEALPDSLIKQPTLRRPGLLHSGAGRRPFPFFRSLAGEGNGAPGGAWGACVHPGGPSRGPPRAAATARTP